MQVKAYGNLKLTFVAAVAVIVMVGSRQVLSQTPTPEEKLAEKIEHYKEVVNKSPGIGAAEIAQKDARYQDALAKSRQTDAKWLEDFKASGVDIRLLERTEIAVFLQSPSPQTLDEAIRGASAIVSGRATGVDFSRNEIGLPRAVVQFRVDEVLAGTAAEIIEVAFTAGPTDGGSRGPLMSYTPHAPPLLPGDEAILMLIPSQRDPAVFVPKAFTGVNKIQNGIVQASKRDGEDLTSLTRPDARKLFDGVAEAGFVTQLREAIARN